MTISLYPEQGRHDGGNRTSARIAAVAAFALTALPPRAIATVLRWVAHGARSASVGEASAAREEVCSVSTRCAGQGCLQRSIATCILCRLRGSMPEWRTGYMVRPFVAHAWVECEGEPIGESPDVKGYVTALAVRPQSANTP